MEPHNHHRRSRVMHRDVHVHPKRVEVVTDIVYVTASVSPGGKVVGFTTLDDPVATTPSPTKVEPKVTSTSKAASSERPQPPTTSEKPKTTEAAKTTQSVTSSTSESTTEASSSSTSTFATSTSSTVSTSESILTSTSASLSASTSASSASSSASETSSETSASIAPTASSTGEPASGGLSTGATIGLAVAGVGVFLVFCFVFALVYRKRSQKKVREAYGKPEDEKAGGAAAGAAYTNSNNNLSRADTITCEKAPRVPSLRPVTQFLPNLTVTPPAAEPVSQQQPQAQVQPQPQQQVPIAASPVGLTRSESRKAPPPALVFTKSEEEVPSAPVSAATTANSVAPLLAKTQTSSISSSSSAEYTDGGSVAGTPVTGGPVGAANTSPVHRVQMDFKPSMEDELGLRVGQLVRLLYEYDDGWALCIRLDRSQQGVCPRTCLSQRPVKPRPQGSPRPSNTPNGRPQSPAGSQGPHRPYSPAGGPRAQSPGLNGGQFSQSPAQMRPQSPAQVPPQSPGGYVKQVYRPATPTQQAQLRIIPATPVQRPQSPITQSPVSQSPVSLRAGPSQITVTTTTPAVISEVAPPTPVSPIHEPQSPSGSPPRPAVAPVRPSPLSNEQTSNHEPEPAQPVFHAM